jgi:hypothetical protein
MKINAAPGNILQVAYTVPDIEAAVRHYVQVLKIGPWFVRGPMQAANALYRGAPTRLSLSIAISFSGSLQIELIEQHNDAPSVYTDLIRKRGHGFHHWGIASVNIDRDIDAYRARGYELVYSNVTPAGSRIAYLDSSAELPGMIELIEMTDAQLARYTQMHDAAARWNGGAPIIRT